MFDKERGATTFFVVVILTSKPLVSFIYGQKHSLVADTANSMASTTSQGFNARMEPALSVGGGVYRLTNIKVDKSYAVEVRVTKY